MKGPSGHVGGDLRRKGPEAGTGSGAEADLRGGRAGRLGLVCVGEGGFRRGCWDGGEG